MTRRSVMLRIIGVVIAAIVLINVSACSTLLRRSSSAMYTTVTNDAARAQLIAAELYNIPVEKTLPKSGIVLRLIPPGTFVMGSPKSDVEREVDETQHKVTLTKPFYIGCCEVTQGQWKRVMGSSPSYFNNVGDNVPVECDNVDNCKLFMSKLSRLEGMPEGSFRLPTEAQWEYACRAGTETAFCYGDDLELSMANFNGNGNRECLNGPVSVGSFIPNAWGLYDMHGNVWEWTSDIYGDYERDATDPSGTTLGTYLVVRGGNWSSVSRHCRSASRANNEPDGAAIIFAGFRLVLPAGQ